MKKSYYFKNIVIIAIITILVLCNSCYAVEVTNENLESALKAYEVSSTNSNGYEIEVSDNVINISKNGVTYKLNYDLTDKPTFYITCPIQNGMTYDEYEAQTDALSLTMIGYIATAYIQGVDFEDSSAYIEMCYLMSVLSSSSSSTTYTIVDDLNLDEGVTINKDESDQYTIYTSEFGDRVMELANNTYGTPITISDSSSTVGGIDSFEWVIQETDVTDTSCNLVSTLSVNLDADFSQINGYVNGGYSSNFDPSIYDIDYTVQLKVGQTCIIETEKDRNGYSLVACDFGDVDISTDYSSVTGVTAGNVIYTFYFDNNETVNIYFVVSENTNNETLENITLNIDEDAGTTGSTNGNNTNNSASGSTSGKNYVNTSGYNTSTYKTDNSTSSTTLPYTGWMNFVVLIAGVGILSIIIFGVKANKYKDIK